MDTQLRTPLLKALAQSQADTTLPATAIDILIEAADCIGERADQRDTPGGERSMLRAVLTFNALTGHELTEREGWVMMAVLKLARAQAGRHVLDDYIDGAAYIALAGESLGGKAT